MNLINGSLKFLASGSYAIIYIYANELFPTNVRNTGMGICSMVARIGAIIGTFCNDYLVSSYLLKKLIHLNLIDSHLDTSTYTYVWYCFIDSCSISFNVS
jgi:MFS family permease